MKSVLCRANKIFWKQLSCSYLYQTLLDLHKLFYNNYFDLKQNDTLVMFECFLKYIYVSKYLLLL